MFLMFLIAVQEFLDNKVLLLLLFCSSSTSRWGKVVRNTKVKSTLKSLSSTRWSCRYDPTKALWENYTVIKEASFAISISETEKRETKKEAERICLKLGLLETAFMTIFWNTILERFQANSLSFKVTQSI